MRSALETTQQRDLIFRCEARMVLELVKQLEAFRLPQTESANIGYGWKGGLKQV